MPEFSSGPLKGQSKLKVAGIAAVAIVALALAGRFLFF